jgi:hypothetical protein
MIQCGLQRRRVRLAPAIALLSLSAWMSGSISQPLAGLAMAQPTSSPDSASTSQPDGQGPFTGATSAPEELESLPQPAVGQSATYLFTSAGPASRLRQTVESAGPGADITVSEQVLLNNQPAGKPTMLHLPRFARWPAPIQSDARTIRYSREKIDLAGQNLDCVVLTIEARAGGVTRVMKEWVCPAVPVTHVARLIVTTDGREVFKQEMVEFGVGNK